MKNLLSLFVAIIMATNLHSQSQTFIQPVGGINLTMVNVKGGSFLMFSSYSEDAKPDSVTLNSFFIGKTDITQSQWKAVMGSNPSSNPGCNNCPVENVSWNDIQVFLGKLNKLTGKNYRLPTEAEWEFAALRR